MAGNIHGMKQTKKTLNLYVVHVENIHREISGVHFTLYNKRADIYRAESSTVPYDVEIFQACTQGGGGFDRTPFPCPPSAGTRKCSITITK